MAGLEVRILVRTRRLELAVELGPVPKPSRTPPLLLPTTEHQPAITTATSLACSQAKISAVCTPSMRATLASSGILPPALAHGPAGAAPACSQLGGGVAAAAGGAPAPSVSVAPGATTAGGAAAAAAVTSTAVSKHTGVPLSQRNGHSHREHQHGVSQSQRDADKDQSSKAAAMAAFAAQVRPGGSALESGTQVAGY